MRKKIPDANLNEIATIGKSNNTFLQRYAIVLVWIVIIIAFSILCPETFPTWLNVSMILGSKATLVILSLAVLIPLTAGDFDLSVAAVLVLSNQIIAVLNVHHGVNVWIAIVVALIAGILVGFINGIFVVKMGIDPFIVTLGMQTLVCGVILWISNSQTVNGIDRILVEWTISKRLFGISYIFFYALILTAIVWYFLEFTSAGKKILYAGRGRNVARLSGINVDKVRWLCLIGSGFLSAVAGVSYAGTTGCADPTSGLTFMMPAFAAAYFGSTCIKPGRFNAWGCLIAVYFLGTGVTGFSLLGAPTFIQNIFYGLALIVAVSFSVIVKKKQDSLVKFRNTTKEDTALKK